MIEHDYELIKDLIADKHPETERDGIIIDSVNIVMGRIFISYEVKETKEIHGTKRVLTYTRNFSIDQEEYESILKAKNRDEKIKGLGL